MISRTVRRNTLGRKPSVDESLGRMTASTLEALAVDDGGTALVVLLLGDPHLLEGGQRGQNGTTDPDRVLALGRSNDLDLHGRRGKSRDLLLHAVGKTRVHGGTTRLHGLAVALFSRSENIP